MMKNIKFTSIFEKEKRMGQPFITLSQMAWVCMVWLCVVGFVICFYIYLLWYYFEVEGKWKCTYFGASRISQNACAI